MFKYERMNSSQKEIYLKYQVESLENLLSEIMNEN